MTSTLPTGQGFELRVSMHTVASSVATAALLVLYVLPNFRLSEGQVHALLWSVAVLITTVTPAAFVAYRRISRPVSTWIDLHHAGGPIPDAIRDAAFRSILALPLQVTLTSLSMWLLCGTGICLGLLWFEETSRFAIGVMFAAVLGTAAVTQVFGYVKLRRDVRSIREALAHALPDPARRAELAPSLSLSTKLTAATVSLVGAAVVMSVGMSQVQAAGSTAVLIAKVQSDCVDQIVTRIEGGQPAERAIAEVRGFYDATVEFVRITELVPDISSAGLDGILLQAEWEVVLAGSETAGTSAGVDTPHSFAWAPLPDMFGRVLVVSASDQRLMPMAWTTQALFFGWVAIATILAIAVGRSVGAELGETTARLQEQARRIADGDLRVRVTVESEDELGDLARSLDVMGSALRSTLGAATEAADELEGASAEMASSADQVASSAQAQQASLFEVSQRLDRIQEKSGEISASATEVRMAMDESASSSVQLRASTGQLRETAGVLSEQVEASAGSLQSSGESLRQIAQSTEALRAVADEMAASVDALAESARNVGGEAEDTSTLSIQVHQAAEKGREQVRESIRGMQTIRESTDLAVDSARKLEKRTQRIDDVVAVIGEVADETRLLGLNAAIIAAQAGDSGSGFGVVASQIRQLATRVQTHTGEVSGLLAGIRDETSHLVEAVEDSARQVEVGMELAAQSGEALNEITESARQSGERMRRIVDEVQVQASTTSRTATEMETLRGDVERIGEATREQERNANLMLQSHSMSEDASAQLRRTSEEQVGAVERISQEVEQVRSAMSEIDSALSHQADACGAGAEALRDVATRSEEGERTAKVMSESMRGLLTRAEALRAKMRRFQL